MSLQVPIYFSAWLALGVGLGLGVGVGVGLVTNPNPTPTPSPNQVPIYFSAGLVERANAYYKLFASWMAPQLQAEHDP